MRGSTRGGLPQHYEPIRGLIDSFQKRQRDRRKSDKRKEKAARKVERALLGLPEFDPADVDMSPQSELPPGVHEAPSPPPIPREPLP